MSCLSILPLAFEDSSQVINTVLGTVRASAMAKASTNGALALATFIVGIKLIRMAYYMFSDEQQGGFGGIRLSQVLRPILIILAINISGTVFGYVDSFVNYISGSVAQTFGSNAFVTAFNRATDAALDRINASKEALADIRNFDEAGIYDEAFKEALIQYREFAMNTLDSKGTNESPEAQARRDALYVVQQAKNELLKKTQENILSLDTQFQTDLENNQKWFDEEAEKIKTDKEAGIGAGFSLSSQGGNSDTFVFGGQNGWGDVLADNNYNSRYAWLIAEKTRRDNAARDDALRRNVNGIEAAKIAINAAGQVNGISASMEKLFDENYKEEKRFWKSVTDPRWWERLIMWFYDVIAFSVNTFASIGLILMSLFFPWILCLSLLDYYKQGIWQFCTTYLSLSLYKVVAAGICWIVSAAQGTMKAISIFAVLPNLSATADKLEAIDVSLTTSAILYIAGAICLTKTGSIVKMILPQGADSGDIGNAGGALAMGAGRMMAGGAKKAAGGAASVATGTTGIQSAAKAKKESQSTSAFRQSVTNALGKMSGGGTP